MLPFLLGVDMVELGKFKSISQLKKFLMKKDILTILRNNMNRPIPLLKELDGYYECPKDAEGKRLGYLVGYAARYDTDFYGNKLAEPKQYVGDLYFNFAKMEERPVVLNDLASRLDMELTRYTDEGPIVFVGPQMGGIALAQFLALHAEERTIDARYACAEKKQIESPSAENPRGKTILEFARHSINPGDNIIIVEDVMNNFSTTDQIIELVEKHGAKVVCITGALNRSPNVEHFYPYGDKKIPVRAYLRIPAPEWKQDDPAVAADIEAGKVMLKPKSKESWPILLQVMEKYKNIAV